MKTPPSLTCFVFAHNHQEFIADCLSSIASQVGNFRLNVVVHDDNSQDNTAGAAREFLGRTGIPSKVIESPKNMHSMGLHFFWDTLRLCDTDYLRMISADDFFIRNDVFSRQIELLERHPEVSLCHANFTTSLDDKVIGPSPSLRSRIYPGNLLGLGNQIGALTAMLRRTMFPLANSTLLDQGLIEDYPLWLEMARKGEIAHINFTAATLRIHDGNLWSSKSSRERAHAVELYEEALVARKELPGNSLRKMVMALPRRVRPLARHMMISLLTPFTTQRHSFD